jgi:hypothetical protein
MADRPDDRVTEPDSPSDPGVVPGPAGGEESPATRRDHAGGDGTTRAAADSRRRLAEVFGDVLPDTTRDERSPAVTVDEDERLRREVPPHHT